jgi:D-amino-acid oxidase
MLISNNTLTPLQVSPDRVIRHISGLRPFRPRGFVVKSEKLGNKMLIHNYGHGGCGVTLCWGTAQLALEEALKTGHRHFAVLGCGAVGLATARLFQSEGFHVTIYAKDLPPKTTSNVAGAVWFPVTFSDGDQLEGDNLPRDFETRFCRAANFSHRYFQNLLGDEYGVRWLTVYFFSSGELSDSPRVQTLRRFSELFPDIAVFQEPQRFFGFPMVQRFRTLLIEPDVYLKVVLGQFLNAGGQLIFRSFDSAGELAELPQPVIVNCTGLGARKLFHDEELIPVKGQLTFLRPQPEIDYGYVVIDPETDLYMFPRRDGILLGGTHERGEWSLEPDPKHVKRILEGHARISAG